MDNTPIQIDHITLGLAVKHGTIAIFGAVAHALNVHRTGGSKGIVDFLLLSLMSSLSGAMFALVAIHYFPESEYLSLAAAAQ